MNKNTIQANEEEEEADDNQQAKMPATSNSNRRRRANRSKFVQKPKQRWQVKQPTRNWLELPSDIMANILYRVGVHDILEHAQKVCTTWRKICKDPAMWRVIYMRGDPFTRHLHKKMCKHAVDRSQGQLLNLTIRDFADDEILTSVGERSSQLERLRLMHFVGRICGVLGDVLKNFSLLEELSLFGREISEEDIEAAGRYCPLLKTLKVNQKSYRMDERKDESIARQNTMAIAIGKTLPALRHLELIGNIMSDIGLKAILDGCCHLETLDLRGCFNIHITGHMGKECVERIKNLKLPYDSLECRPDNSDNKPWDVSSDSGFYLDDYERYFDHGDNNVYDYSGATVQSMFKEECYECW